MQFRFTRSARRHRVGKARALYVMLHSDPEVLRNARGEAEFRWRGTDDRGLELEIVGAAINDGTVLVFHVMPSQFRGGTS